MNDKLHRRAKNIIHHLVVNEIIPPFADKESAEAAENVIANTWDVPVPDTVSRDESIKATRDEQREDLKNALFSWMAKVYQHAPDYSEGESMKLTIEAGRVCEHPEHDYSLFAFMVETTGPREEF